MWLSVLQTRFNANGEAGKTLERLEQEPAILTPDARSASLGQSSTNRFGDSRRRSWPNRPPSKVT